MLPLPPEVVHGILRHCDASSLKSLRLASKTTICVLAAEYLFEELWIVPNLNCLQQFISVFNKSSAALLGCFRRLNYDASCENLLSDLRPDVEKVQEGKNIPEHLVGLDFELLSTVLALSNRTESTSVAKCLATILRKTPRLTQLLVQPETNHSLERRNIHPYYRPIFTRYYLGSDTIPSNELRRRNFSQLQPSESVIDLWPAMQSIASPLQDLSLYGGSWYNMIPYGPKVSNLRPILQSVRRLILNFAYSSYVIQHRHTYGSLRRFLRACSNVEVLHMCVQRSALMSMYRGDTLRQLSLLLPVVNLNEDDILLWPRLCRVTLDGIAVKPRHLLQFLRDHPTIRDLALRNLCLLSSRDNQNPACWGAFVEHLRDLKLMKIDFSGLITTGSISQSWWVSETDGDDHRIKPSVSRYVLGLQAQNPLKEQGFEGDWTWARIDGAALSHFNWHEISGEHLFDNEPAEDEGVVALRGTKRVKHEHTANFVFPDVLPLTYMDLKEQYTQELSTHQLTEQELAFPT